MFIRRAASLTPGFFLMATIGFCAESGLKSLPGHVPSVVARLAPEADLPPTNQLALAIGLPLHNPAALDEFLRQLYDPHSADYHKFLTPEEFTARFGPTPSDYAVVENFARDNGFQITATHGNRLLLDVRASVADIQRAFHIRLRKFKHPHETRDFFAPDVDPTVDLKLPIADISGLNNFQLPRPKLIKQNSTTNPPAAKSGSAPTGEYLGNDFRAAYVPDTALTGAGQMVGLLQFDNYYGRDVSTYARAAGGGRENIPVQTVLIDGYNGVPQSGNNETALDIEMAMAMAPGLAKIIVFSGGPNGSPNDILNMMAASNTVKNLSCSWAWSGGPSVTTDAIFQQMAAQGQSFFNASADSGAFTDGASSANGVDDASQPNAPASSPYITQVGGTVLTTSGPGGAWQSEMVWNGSSGGVSSHYAIPFWQTGVNMSVNQGSTTKRNIPDVALTADNVYYFSDNGSAGGVSGTSCAAPLWAGLTALVNEQAAAAGKSAVGFLNPAVYAIGEGSNGTTDFHDVVTGNNTSGVSPSQFYAAPGYDLCTGWGTPAGQSLIDALLAGGNSGTGFLEIISASQITSTGAAGGPFTPGAFVITLTNSGSAPLTWALLNPSATSWLKISPAGGSIKPQAGTNLLVNFTTTVDSLAVGNYSASLKITNLASTVVRQVNFQLQVLPIVSVQPAVLNLSGPVGGPFIPAAQAFDISNFGGSSLTWKVMESSKWLAVKPASGTASTGGHSKFSVSLTSKANKLAAGVYRATLTVRTKKNQILQTVPVFLSVGAQPATTPRFQNITRAPSSFNLTFAAEAGAVYQIQCKTNLMQPDWMDLGDQISAESDLLKFTDTNIVNYSQKFYRLIRVP